MNIVREKCWGPVRSLKTGYGPLGKPLMTVYLFQIDDLLVDTGQSNMQQSVCAWLNSHPPRRVILTHHHEDHSGNAAVIHQKYGATIQGSEHNIRKMSAPYRILPYQRLVWGKTAPVAIQPIDSLIETEKHRFHPVPTPGHSKDHTSFYEKEMGWLFAGDLYLGDRIKYFRTDERFADQIDSLKTVLRLDFDALFCAHNPHPQKGKKRLAAKLCFLEELYDNIRSLWKTGYPQKEIVRRVKTMDDFFVRTLTMGNASFGNMVRSALSDITQEKKVSVSSQKDSV
jgi:glyoxylase-like metal-dependent hydrolase (beta-lactamase superfamily II)